MLNSILSNITTTVNISLSELLICSGASVVLGILLAAVFTYKNTYTKSFILTLATLPLIVQAVIMLVNGNIGAGVAVAGAFSLVRFRSAQGTAREISAIFLAMAMGLACGMGYVAVAAILLAVYALVMAVLLTVRFGDASVNERLLKVTMPEDVDYTGALDDIFARFTTQSELVRTKTTNMGSLYELNYRVKLKDRINEKEFIDQIRTRNANLTVILAKVADGKEEL